MNLKNILMILIVAIGIILVGCKSPGNMSKTAVVDKTVTGDAAITPEEAEISGGLDDIKQLDTISSDLEEDVNFDDLEKMTVE